MTNTSTNVDVVDRQTNAAQRWGLMLGLIGVLLFAGTLPATRIAIAEFSAGFLTFGRATVAFIAAAVCLVLMKKRFPKKHVTALLIAGLLLVFGFPGFVTLAMLTVPASHGGVVLGILPLSTAIFAVLLAGERPSPLFWACGVTGAALIIAFTLRGSHWSFELGDLWLLAAALSASAGYVISGKLSHHMPGWEVICWCLILCAPVSAIGTFWFWEPQYSQAAAPQVWAFAYISLGSMFLGFFAWNSGLKLGGIAKVGQLQLLQTFFTLGISAMLLGEKITLETLGFAFALLITVLVGRQTRVAR